MNKIEKQINQHKVLMTMIYSFIFAFGLNTFLTPENIFATGLTGIAQIIDVLIPSISFAIIYLLINIPGVVIGFMYLGKKFTLYSLLSIFVVSISTALLPTVGITDDPILNCIFGGIVMGYGMGGLLKFGSSSGGLDFYSLFLYQKFGIGFTSFQTTFNIIIVVASGLLFGIEICLYSLLALFVRQLMLSKVYTTHNKVTIWIVGENVGEVSDFINYKLGRGTNIFHNVEGGYTHKQKQVLMAILDEYEFRELQDKIDQIDSSVFLYATEARYIGGNYRIKLKK